MSLKITKVTVYHKREHVHVLVSKIIEECDDIKNKSKILVKFLEIKRERERMKGRHSCYLIQNTSNA